MINNDSIDLTDRRSFLKKSGMAGGAILLGGEFAFAGGRGKKKKVTLAEAWELHKKCLIIDGHTDTPVERMSGRHELPMRWMNDDPSYQEDIPRMRINGQKYTGFMIISAGRGTSPDAFRNFAEMERQFSEYPNDLKKVLTSEDVLKAASEGKIGVICCHRGRLGTSGRENREPSEVP